MLETWERLDPEVKSELESCIEDVWNSTKALNEEIFAENIGNFLDSLKNSAIRPWKTIGERLTSAQEEEVVDLSLDEVAGGEEVGALPALLTFVIGTSGVILGDEVIGNIVDSVYNEVSTKEKYVEVKTEVSAAMFIVDASIKMHSGYEHLKHSLTECKDKIYTDLKDEYLGLKKNFDFSDEVNKDAAGGNNEDGEDIVVSL